MNFTTLKELQSQFFDMTRAQVRYDCQINEREYDRDFAMRRRQEELFEEMTSPGRRGFFNACLHAVKRTDREILETWLNTGNAELLEVLRFGGDQLYPMFDAHLRCALLAVEWTHRETDESLKSALRPIAEETALPVGFLSDLTQEFLVRNEPHRNREARVPNQSLPVLFVEEGGRNGEQVQTDGAVVNLIVALRPNGDGEFYPATDLAFVHREESFIQAEENSKAYVTQEGLWFSGYNVSWRLQRKDRNPLPLRLKGSSLGGAFTVELLKLFADQWRGRPHKNPLFTQLKELALSYFSITATVEQGGSLKPVNVKGLSEKASAARGMKKDYQPIHTVVVALNQEIEGFRFIQGPPVNRLQSDDNGDFYFLPAQTVPEAIEKLVVQQRTRRSEIRSATVLYVRLDLPVDTEPQKYAEQIRVFHEIIGTIDRDTDNVNKNTDNVNVTIDFFNDEACLVFGTPKAGKNDASNAASTARKIRQIAEGHQLNLRMGITTGPVYLGATGPRGPLISEARQLQADAKPGEILIDHTTYGWIKDGFKCTPETDETAAVYKVLKPIIIKKEDPAAGRVDFGRVRSGVSRFITKKNKNGNIIGVIASIPDDKQQLLASLKKEFEGKLRWLEGGPYPSAQQVDYWPFREICQTVAGATEEDNYEESLRELKSLFVSLDESRELGSELNRSDMTERIFQAVWKLFERLAREGPLAVVIQDLNRVDESTITLLKRLLPLVRKNRILFYADGDPCEDELSAVHELRDLAADKYSDYYRQTLLTPFSLSLLKTPDAFEQRIWFYFDNWLNPNQREILKIGAYVGFNSDAMRFPRAALEEILGDTSHLDNHLGALQYIGFLARNTANLPEGIYRFRFQKIQDTIYESIPMNRRTELLHKLGKYTLSDLDVGYQ